MKKRTVAIVGENFGATGKGLYTVKIAQLVQKLSKNYNVKLFVRDTNPYNSNFVVKVKTFKTNTRIFAGLGYYLPLIYKLSKDKSIDIIHAYDEKTNAFLSFLKKPKVVTVCDLYPLDYKFPFNFFFDKIYRMLDKADYVSSISNYVGEKLGQRYNFLSKKIIPIYLGTDIKRFKPKKKKQSKQITVGILCNLDKDLAKVFERLLKEYGKNIKIIIGGRDIPKEFDYLRSIPGISFRGFIEESKLPDHYRDIDIFAYKSHIAAFELIPVEAMASGCAVIASDVGALKEVVNKSGMLVEDTEDGFYKGIKELIENKKLRNKYKKQGRKRAEELTWEECTKNYIKLYDKTLKKSS